MKYRLWACLLFLPMVLWASGRPKVAVVLSGGGAKGTAHIGALKVIEEAGIPIDYVVGTSMGAIVGGLYSIGYTPQQLDSITRSLTRPTPMHLRSSGRPTLPLKPTARKSSRMRSPNWPLWLWRLHPSCSAPRSTPRPIRPCSTRSWRKRGMRNDSCCG